MPLRLDDCQFVVGFESPNLLILVLGQVRLCRPVSRKGSEGVKEFTTEALRH